MQGRLTGCRRSRNDGAGVVQQGSGGTEWVRLARSRERRRGEHSCDGVDPPVRGLVRRRDADRPEVTGDRATGGVDRVTVDARLSEDRVGVERGVHEVRLHQLRRQ